MDNRAIQVVLPGGVRVDALYKGHVIKTDQPIDDGGTDTAPSPFDLFLASLATCAGYYVVSFCQSRKIPADGVTLAMTYERPPGTKLISRIRIEISLPPDFPEKYKDAVVRAADQCTVRLHLDKPPAVETAAVYREA